VEEAEQKRGCPFVVEDESSTQLDLMSGRTWVRLHDSFYGECHARFSRKWQIPRAFNECWFGVISWRPVLVVEEAGVPGENQTSPLWSCKRFYRYIFLIYFLSNKLFVT
jgi:hypothetical protein